MLAHVEEFLSLLKGVRETSNGWEARCPCRNDDDNPSLAVAVDKNNGNLLVTCHRGSPCNSKEICSAMGVTEAALFNPKTREKPKSNKLTLVKSYDYYDENGELLFQKLRYVDEDGKKTFRQRKPDGNGGWEYSLGDTPKVLYNLPQVLNAIKQGKPVWLVEGEKDADTLTEMGHVATTMPGGAGKWLEIHTEALRGGMIDIIADNDEPGREHAQKVYEELLAAGCDVAVWATPKFKDVSEFLGAGGELSELVDAGSVESREDVPPVEDKFGDAVGEIAKLLERDDLSPQQILVKATNIALSIKNDKPVDKGRLVNWSEFIKESDQENYEWVIEGLLERGERVIVVAAEGVGKRATIDSVIPTPSGWTTLGDISVGDEVIDRFGNPVTVTYVSPIEPNPDAYRVSFSDGNYIDADAEHQWYTETLNEREKRKVGGVRTTKEILETLISNRQSKALNHAIPTTMPLNLPEAILPIAPYTLGAWLGDGATVDGSICCEDEEILDAIRSDGYVVRKRESTPNIYGILGLQAQLKEQGLYGNKHIPAIYSRASYEQRLALVQGLMDTDGYVSKGGLCEFSVNHQELAKGFLDIIQTLGIKATMREGESKLYGKVTGTRYRISFKTDIPVCRLKRKAERLPEKLTTPRSLYRYIVSVKPIPPVPMRCISVDGPDNTYLIGDAYIPTHNTMLARQVAILAGNGIHPFTYQRMRQIRTLTVDLENPERIIRRTSRKIMEAAIRRGYASKPDVHLLIKPAGLDLLTVGDRQILEAHIEEIRPELLVMGPLYKSFVDPGGRTSEAVAVEIAKYLDYIRDTYKCALWLEHHAPLGTSMSTRDLRPFGSAVWSRWPEFGLSLTPDLTSGTAFTYDVKHFRGARDERQWPTKMKRGTLFPFEVLDFMKVEGL